MWFHPFGSIWVKSSSCMSGLLSSGRIRKNLPDILLVHPALLCSSSDDDGGERNLQAEKLEPENLDSSSPCTHRHSGPVISSHWLWTSAMSHGFLRPVTHCPSLLLWASPNWVLSARPSAISSWITISSQLWKRTATCRGEEGWVHRKPKLLDAIASSASGILSTAGPLVTYQQIPMNQERG